MSKIVFIAPVYRGHIVATESLVKALSLRGHEIIYYTPLKYKQLIENMQVEYRSYPEMQSLEYLMATKLPPSDLYDRLLRLTKGSVNAAQDIIPFLIKELSKQNIDLIIYDNMAIWGHVIAKELSIPSICSTTVMAINDETIKNTGEGTVYKSNLPGYVEEPLKQLQQIYPSDISSLVDLISGQYSPNIILYTSHYLQRHAQYFNNEKYIFFPMRYMGQEFDAYKPAPNDRIAKIYVSFGTLYNHDENRFIQILDAFQGTSHHVILSTGGEKEVYNHLLQHNTNPNIEICLMVDQNSILKNSDIFITHGGFNSVQESIFHLIPMIIMPIAGDQNFIAKRLVELNVAKTIDNNLSSSQQILNHVGDMVENWDTYQQNLSILRDSLSDANAMEEALLSIEAIEQNFYHSCNKDEL